MSDWVTAFIFTDKSQIIINELQREMKSDVVVIILCIIYLLYVVIAKIRKIDYFDRKLVPVVLFILVIGISSLPDDYKRLQYFQGGYAKLATIYENQAYKIAEGVVRVQYMQPAGGHTAGDIIRVDDVEIELSCFSSTFGYNETIAYGGVLTEGTLAKIYYYQSGTEFPDQNLILRIDLLNNKSSMNENSTILRCTR
jgi:hypothetical protein